MFIGVIWSAVWNVIVGVVGGEWLGQGGTSVQDTPPQPLSSKPEGEVTTPVIAPKPFVPSGRGGIKVEVSPPSGDNAPKITPPATIDATGVWEDLNEIFDGLFPKIWEWLEENNSGPVPWLSKRIRTRQKELFPKDPTQSVFKFGRLLAGNMSLEILPRWEWTFAVDDATQKEHHQESFEAYAYWLANQAAGIPLPLDYSGNFYDQGAIIWPLDPRDFSGGVTMLFGSQFLGEIFANWWTRSLNYDACTLRGVTYYDISITQSRATWERNYTEDGAEVDSQSGLEGLALSLANIIYEHRLEQAEEGEQVAKPRVLVENGGVGGNSKLDKILAIKDFPFKVPVSFLLEASDLEGMDENELEEKAYEKIESIPQLILWLTRALDELIGKFPLTMEIGESDLINLQEEFQEWQSKNNKTDDSLPFYLQNDKLVSFRRENGKLVKTIKIPNLAEAVGEMMGAGLLNQQQNSLALEFLTRTLLEIGSNKNLSVKNNAILEAILDYLGFATTDKIIDVDYTYNPVVNTSKAENSFKQLLQPTQVQMPIPEFSDKDGFEATASSIKEIQMIVKAALTEGIGKTDGQLKQRIKDYATELGLTAKNTDPEPPNAPKEKDDFDLLLEKIERGFIDQPGITDITKPYGREYEKRPKIRRLTTESTEGNP